jgi:hypothetical protein
MGLAVSSAAFFDLRKEDNMLAYLRHIVYLYPYLAAYDATNPDWQTRSML